MMSCEVLLLCIISGGVVGWIANAISFQRWLQVKAEQQGIIRVDGKNWRLKEVKPNGPQQLFSKDEGQT
jgi:hypothetical protein